MPVKIISRREFRITQKDKLIPLLQKLQQYAQGAEGFISRTTYSSLNDPGEYIVISDWDTADAWIAWMNRDDVSEIQWQIDSLIGEKTFFNVYKPEEF